MESNELDNELSNYNATAALIEQRWLNGTDKECEEISIRLAEFLKCNRYDVYKALTNLTIIVG